MRLFDKYWPKASIVEQMKTRAQIYIHSGKFPPAGDQEGLAIVRACSAQYDQPGLTTTLIFTIDDGMHAIGWWKNPEYARCWHLSLAFWYPDDTVAPKDDKATAEWVELFFHPNARWVWSEPPFSEVGKQKNVWHYRLFVDENWQAIFPQGEVYSTLKTELGWLSWSELQDKLKQNQGEK